MCQARVLRNSLAAAPVLRDVVHGSVINLLDALATKCAGGILIKELLLELEAEAARLL